MSHTPSSAALPVSAYIVCKDERDSLPDCLESLAGCAEIIVVDSGSTDGTLDLIRDRQAAGAPIRLFEREWPGYARQKQFALEQCTQEWCLNLDADERLDQRLRASIRATIAAPGAEGYRLALRGWLPGYGYIHPWVAPDMILRLVRNGRARYDTGRLVHETLIVDGKVATIRDGRLLHKPAQSVEAELAKQNRYTTLKVEGRLADGRRARRWRMLTAPLGYFAKAYILKRYFLCGWAGFAYSLMSAQYAFQTEFKHWRAGLPE